jgi:hypothetical protein
MLFKIILVFLLAMALIGMVGKALFPGTMGKITQIRRKSIKAPVCKTCGRYVIGSSNCDCGKS